MPTTTSTTESAVLVDGINAIAIHNGVIRIEFMRLDMNGKPIPNLEVQVPASSMRSIIEALKNIPA